MHRLRWIILAAFSTYSASSWAEMPSSAPPPDAPTPLPLRFEAGAGCPSARAFAEGFQERTKRFVLTQTGDPAGSALHVAVGNEPQRSYGRMEIYAGGSIVASRDVEAPTCEEVVSALAFVAALAVEGKSESAMPGPTSSGAAPKSPPSSDAAQAAPKVVWDRRFAAGVHSAALLGVFPDVAPDIDLFLEFRRVRTKEVPDVTDVDGLGPTFRLSLRAAPSQPTKVDPVGEARFQRFSATLSGCPWWIGFGRELTLAHCATAEVGVLTAVLKDVSSGPPTEVAKWVSFGAQSWLRWVISPPLFVEAYAHAQVPLWQTEFIKGSGTSEQRIYKVAPVCGALGLGMGFEL